MEERCEDERTKSCVLPKRDKVECQPPFGKKKCSQLVRRVLDCLASQPPITLKENNKMPEHGGSCTNCELLVVKFVAFVSVLKKGIWIKSELGQITSESERTATQIVSVPHSPESTTRTIDVSVRNVLQ